MLRLSFQLAFAVLFCNTAWGQWRLTVPPYDQPTVLFFDGTGTVQDAGYLTSFHLTWKTDSQGVVRDFVFTCVSPDEGVVNLTNLVYPGSNWVYVTATYSDRQVLKFTNIILGAGFKFWTTNGKTNFTYRVKAHLQDYQWTTLTNASPFFGLYTTPQQFFWLPANVSHSFYRDSLYGEPPPDTNTPITNLGLPTPPLPIP